MVAHFADFRSWSDTTAKVHGDSKGHGLYRGQASRRGVGTGSVQQSQVNAGHTRIFALVAMIRQTFVFRVCFCIAGSLLRESHYCWQGTVVALNESKRQSEAEAGVNWLVASLSLPQSILSIAQDLKVSPTPQRNIQPPYQRRDGRSGPKWTMRREFWSSAG